MGRKLGKIHVGIGRHLLHRGPAAAELCRAGTKGALGVNPLFARDVDQGKEQVAKLHLALGRADVYKRQVLGEGCGFPFAGGVGDAEGSVAAVVGVCLGFTDVPADVAGAVCVRAKSDRHLGVGKAT